MQNTIDYFCKILPKEYNKLFNEDRITYIIRDDNNYYTIIAYNIKEFDYLIYILKYAFKDYNKIENYDYFEYSAEYDSSKNTDTIGYMFYEKLTILKNKLKIKEFMPKREADVIVRRIYVRT